MTQPFTVYLAAEGYLAQLKDEVAKGGLTTQYGDLLLVEGPPQQSVWAQNIWLSPEWIPISSVGDAAKKLKNLQRNWIPHSFKLHRRVMLIKDQLPYVADKPRTFPSTLATSQLGAFTLVEQNLLLATTETSSPFPGGNPNFLEDHVNPPSRAYLKLWEALLLFGDVPKKGEHCLELGASPGGWTWVLAGLGADITAVDRSPLDDRLKQVSNVQFREGDAFQWTPERVDGFDWIFSDVICYPHKLLEFVRQWAATSTCKAMVCTIKLQGNVDPNTIQSFREIPGSRVLHLYHNKNELTWLWKNPIRTPLGR